MNTETWLNYISTLDGNVKHNQKVLYRTIVDAYNDGVPAIALAEKLDVSRKTIYEWIEKGNELKDK